MDIIPVAYNKFRFYNKIYDQENALLHDKELIEQIINGTDYGGFNLSAGSKPFKINDKYYNLFVIRYIHNTPNMVPGNPRRFENMVKNKPNHIGENYYWGNWRTQCSPECNITFIGEIDIETSNIKVILKLNNDNTADNRILYIDFEQYEGYIVHRFLVTPRRPTEIIPTVRSVNRQVQPELELKCNVYYIKHNINDNDTILVYIEILI